MAGLSFDDLIPNSTPARQSQPGNLSFDDLIPAQAAPAAAPAAAAEPSKAYTGSILPLSRDAEGNVSFDSNAGLVGAFKNAFTAPGRAMSGELPVTGLDGQTSPEAIAEGFNFAGTFGAVPTPAAGTGRAIAAAAPRVERPGMEAAAAANRLGVDLPRAVVSDSTSVQQAGKIITNVPFAGTPLRNASQKAIDQLGQAADSAVNSVGTGNVANAGNAARTGITGYAKGLAGRVTDAYDNVDNLVTQNVTTPLSNTAKTALEITAQNANAALPEGGAVARVREALSRPEGLNYQGIKRLRTSIGEALDSKESIVASGASEAELTRLYGSLTDDLKQSVARGGGEKASKAFEEANKLAARTSREREALQKVLGNDVSDERLFDRITAMAGSNSRADRVSLARVKGAVSGDTWNEISSGVISRLGRDADGNFSPDRFITGYGRISPEGKRSLFGSGELANSLDDIATVSRRFKQLNQFANPSGTGQTVLGGAIGTGLYNDPISTVATTVGARVVSSLLSKPVSAKALAAYSRAYANAAQSPTNATLRVLENTSRAVAAIAAHNAGDKSLAQTFLPQLSSVKSVPADQGNENNGATEDQNQRVYDASRRLMPNET